MKNLWIVTIAVTISILSSTAHAHLELVGYYAQHDFGGDAAETAFAEAELGLPANSLTFLGKVEGFSGDTFGGQIIVTDYDNSDDREATVSWDLTGTGWTLAGVLVKDGEKAGSTLYSVSLDQLVLGLGDTVMLNPDIAQGGISHISFFGVPEPTTVIAGALLLLPFAASMLRCARRNPRFAN